MINVVEYLPKPWLIAVCIVNSTKITGKSKRKYAAVVYVNDETTIHIGGTPMIVHDFSSVTLKFNENNAALHLIYSGTYSVHNYFVVGSQPIPIQNSVRSILQHLHGRAFFRTFSEKKIYIYRATNTIVYIRLLQTLTCALN